MAISAVVCRTNDWVAVETFGKAKESWLQQFLALPHGIHRMIRLDTCVCAAQAGAMVNELCELDSSGGTGDSGASGSD